MNYLVHQLNRNPIEKNLAVSVKKTNFADENL